MKIDKMGMLLFRGAAMLWVVLSSSTGWAQYAGAKQKQIEAAVQELRSALDDLTGGASGSDIRARIDAASAALEALQAEISSLKAEKAIEKDRADATAKDLEKVKTALETLSAETEALKKKVSEADANPPAGYDRDGFFIATKDRRFALTLSGFARPRYTLVLEREWKTDAEGNILSGADRNEPDSVVAQNGFDIQTARLIMEIRATEYFNARVEIDYGQAADAPIYSKRFETPEATDLLGDRSLSPALRILDLFGAYHPIDAIAIRAGQMKVSFDKESRYLPTESPFAALSLISRRYRRYGDLPMMNAANPSYRHPYEVARGARFGRDIGAELGASLLGKQLDIRLGVYNGAGLGKENDNRDVLTALRVEGHPLGEMTAGIADTAFAEQPLLTLGGGVAFDLLSHQSAYEAETRYNSADWNATLDFHVKWKGASALASIFYRHADHGGGIFKLVEDTLRADAVQSFGGMFQLAYHHAKTRLTPAARYAIYDPALARSQDHVHEASTALSYDIVAEHVKLTAAYTGCYPSNKTQSYLAPRPSWVDNRHEISLVATFDF